MLIPTHFASTGHNLFPSTNPKRGGSVALAPLKKSFPPLCTPNSADRS